MRSATVTFDTQAPGMRQIAQAVEALTELPVEVVEPEPPVMTDSIAFRSAPATPVEIGYVMERDGSGNRIVRSGTADKAAAGMAPEGCRTIRVGRILGEEPTLLFATLLSLEVLGGRIHPALPQHVRQRYDGPIRESELAARHQRNWPKRYIGNALLLSWAIPALVLQVVLGVVWAIVLVPFFLISFPWVLWRHRHAIRKGYQRISGNRRMPDSGPRGGSPGAGSA